MGTKVLLGTPLMASSVGLIPADPFRFFCSGLRMEKEKEMDAVGALAFQKGLAMDSPALPAGRRGLSPSHSGVSLCLGSPPIQPCAQVRG